MLVERSKQNIIYQIISYINIDNGNCVNFTLEFGYNRSIVNLLNYLQEEIVFLKGFYLILREARPNILRSNERVNGVINIVGERMRRRNQLEVFHLYLIWPPTSVIRIRALTRRLELEHEPKICYLRLTKYSP